MSSVNVPLADTAVAYGGLTSDGSSLAGRNYRFLTAGGSQLDLQVGGTDSFNLDVLIDASNGIKWSIDGGTETATSLTTGSWQTLTIALPDSGSHRVTVKQNTNNVYLDRTNGITLTAASGTPTYSRPSWLGTISAALTGTGTAYIHAEGGWDDNSFGPYSGIALSANPGPLVGVRYRCTGPASLWVFCNGGGLYYTVNGVAGTTVAMPNDNRWNWVTVYTPGNGTQYEIVVYFTGSDNGLYQVAADTIDQSTTFARRPTLVQYGDSNLTTAGATSMLTTVGFLVARSLDLAICSRGIGFTTMAVAANNGTGLFDQVVTTKAGANTSTNIPGTSHPRIYDATRTNPKYILIYYGANDMADNWFDANAANGHEAPSDLEAGYTDCLEYLRDDATLTNLEKVICFPLHPRSDVSDSVRGVMPTPTAGTWNAAIKDAVTAVADARFVAVDTESLADQGIHITDTEQAQLATIALAELAPATDGIPPDAPTLLSATPGDSIVALLWTTPANTDSFTIYRSTNGTDFSVLTTRNVADDPLSDGSVSNGTSYWYYVTASDADPDESDPSNTIGPVVPFVPATPNPPAAPRGGGGHAPQRHVSHLNHLFGG